MKADRSRPGWWRSGLALCRACGRAFEPVRPLVCESALCGAWLARYADALQSGAPLPLEYGLQAAYSPQPATISAAQSPRSTRTRDRRAQRDQGSRRVTRRYANAAMANELHQEQRERAAIARGVETIEAKGVLS